MPIMLEHPAITRVERTGYSDNESSHYGYDYFGNEVLVTDEILVLGDEFFLKEPLSQETIDVLLLAGAEETIAQ